MLDVAFTQNVRSIENHDYHKLILYACIFGNLGILGVEDYVFGGEGFYVEGADDLRVFT